MSTVHTVKCLDASDIIFVKFKVRSIASVVWVHESVKHTGMVQSQAMAKFVHSHPEQINATVGFESEYLVVIKMGIAIDFCLKIATG